MPTLFDPVSFGRLSLRNRTVMAPMTRRRSPGGVPTFEVGAYYERRALGGVGMVISEGLAIDHPTAVPTDVIPNMHDPDAISAWKLIALDVQAAGAAFVPQLWHTGGARSKYDDVSRPELVSTSASGVYFPGNPYGPAASEAEIAAIVASYGRAAYTAMAIGCDGINVHGAHGYLIDGFLWNQTNRRGDRYGGAIEDRARFACEVVAECRRQTAPDFPIMFRFSQFKEQAYDAKIAQSPDELSRFLAPLVDAGVDLFDCSTRRFWVPEFEGSDLGLAGWTRKLGGKPVMAVGSVGLASDVVATVHQGEARSGSAGLERLEQMLDRGDFDLVGIGRALISDPDWVTKVEQGRMGELRGFDRADLEHLR